LGRRRRRKVVKVVRRNLPKVFVCPRCGEHSIKVTLDESKGTASIQCSLCGLKGELPASPTTQPVDLYCEFSDKFYAGKLT